MGGLHIACCSLSCVIVKVGELTEHKITVTYIIVIFGLRMRSAGLAAQLQLTL